MTGDDHETEEADWLRDPGAFRWEVLILKRFLEDVSESRGQRSLGSGVFQSRPAAAPVFGPSSAQENQDPGSGWSDGCRGPEDGPADPVHHPESVWWLHRADHRPPPQHHHGLHKVTQPDTRHLTCFILHTWTLENRLQTFSRVLLSHTNTEMSGADVPYQSSCGHRVFVLTSHRGVSCRLSSGSLWWTEAPLQRWTLPLSSWTFRVFSIRCVWRLAWFEMNLWRRASETNCFLFLLPPPEWEEEHQSHTGPACLCVC